MIDLLNKILNTVDMTNVHQVNIGCYKKYSISAYLERKNWKSLTNEFKLLMEVN